MDTIVFKLFLFKLLTSDNFYHKSGKAVPLVNTLENRSCYWTIPTDGFYQEYRLKSSLKYQPLGYRPWRVRIKDIPQNRVRFWLEIEASIPKTLFGHNLYETQEAQVEEAVKAIYDMLLQFGIETSIEEIRTNTKISRVDICKNILIQTPTGDFIKLLQKLQKKRA